jgi:hypothetical protein
MPLILPQHPAPLARPKTPPVQMGHFLTLEHLGGMRATIADLMAELVKLNRSDVIRCVTAISVKLAEPNGSDHERQRAMARQLLPDDLMAGLDKWLRDGQQWNWALFHRRQMWFLLQMAVVACKEDTAACDDPTMAKTIGRAGLMVNDILQAIEPQQDGEKWKIDYHYCFVPSIIPILDQADRMEILARAHQFWFDLPKTAAIAKRFHQCNAQEFASAFEMKYALSLERFYLIAVSLWSGFQNHASNNASPLLLESDQYLVPHFGKDDTARAMAILSQSPDRLACDLFRKPRQNWAVDSSPLKANPIIEVFPGKYACPDIGNLHRYLTEGIYFLLQDAYVGDRFRQLFGYLFEAYINNLIGQFGIESDVLTRTFWPSPKFVGTNDQACDGLLHDRDLALVMEYKTRLLTTREKYAGIPEVTWKGIEDIVAKNASGGKKGAFQLASSIRRMLTEESVVSGKTEFCQANKTTIIPVLIAYEDAIGLGSVRRWADRKMRDALKKEGVDAAKVGPLLILTIHDIEVLEALSHKNQWADLIRGYAKYVQDHPDDPIATFGVFLSKNNFHSEEPGTSFLPKAFTNALKFAEHHLPERICTAASS